MRAMVCRSSYEASSEGVEGTVPQRNESRYYIEPGGHHHRGLLNEAMYCTLDRVENETVVPFRQMQPSGGVEESGAID